MRATSDRTKLKTVTHQINCKSVKFSWIPTAKSNESLGEWKNATNWRFKHSTVEYVMKIRNPELPLIQPWCCPHSRTRFIGSFNFGMEMPFTLLGVGSSSITEKQFWASFLRSKTIFAVLRKKCEIGCQCVLFYVSEGWLYRVLTK